MKGAQKAPEMASDKTVFKSGELRLSDLPVGVPCAASRGAFRASVVASGVIKVGNCGDESCNSVSGSSSQVCAAQGPFSPKLPSLNIGSEVSRSTDQSDRRLCWEALMRLKTYARNADSQ